MLEVEGFEVRTPRETLKQSYAIGWLTHEHQWLQMLTDRTETSHVYHESKAKQIYENIIGYFPEMKETFKELKRRYEDYGCNSDA